MAYATEIIERFEKLKSEYDTLVKMAIEDTAVQFGKLNTEQMYEGLLSTGAFISPPYTANTVAIKRRKGQITDHVTLRDRGYFHAGYRLQVIGEELVEDSDVPYAPALENKYTKAIWGLDDDNYERYVNDDLAPVIKNQIEEITGLTTK